MAKEGISIGVCLVSEIRFRVYGFCDFYTTPLILFHLLLTIYLYVTIFANEKNPRVAKKVQLYVYDSNAHNKNIVVTEVTAYGPQCAFLSFR